MADFRPKARRPRGFQDRRGRDLAAERAIVDRVLAVYETWGFERLETSAFEYADALGKFLPDQDRPNEGVFALTDDDDQWMALRYDLTAPLARFVAENFDALPKPYRRCAAGPVWRNEKPGPGRFREFWQCDADTVGSASPAADAEMIAMACAALEAAGVARRDYAIMYNDRRLLDGILASIGVPAGPEGQAQRLAVLRAIDKFDRLGLAGVEALLGAGRKDESGDFTKGAGLSAEAAALVLMFVALSELPPEERIEALLRDFAVADVGIQDLHALLQTMAPHGRAQFNPTVVRGLEYYTGAVFEAQLLGAGEGAADISFGSVGGGGRYDDLVSRFRGEPIPATGFSVGVSRLAAALAAQREAEGVGPVVVLVLDRVEIADSFSLATTLRNAGIPAEVYLGAGGMKAQMKYADRRNAPVAVIVGSEERARGAVSLKNLRAGAELAEQAADREAWTKGRANVQIEVPRVELVSAVRRMLEEGRS